LAAIDFNDNKTGVGDRLAEVMSDRILPVVKYRVTKRRKNVTIEFSKSGYDT
jgi:hypothetical protein